MAIASLVRGFFMARVELWHDWGWSPTRMVDMGRALGMSYRRQDMFSDITNILGPRKYEREVSALPGDSTIPKYNMTESDWSMPRSYRGFAHVEYTDNKTGEVFTSDISFYDDSNLGSDSWFDKYQEINQDKLEESDVSITGWELFGVMHRKGAPY